MLFTGLNCPQCPAPLPRQAIWRSVTCPYCHTSVTRSDNTVQAAGFHAAYRRVQNAQVGSQTYGIVQRLARGAHAEVFLAQRVHPLPERVILKLALPDAPDSDAALTRSAQALDALQRSEALGAPYFSQRLPQPVVLGTARGSFFTERTALVLRAPPGYWGSLGDVLHHQQAHGRRLDAPDCLRSERDLLERLHHGTGLPVWFGASGPTHQTVRSLDLPFSTVLQRQLGTQPPPNMRKQLSFL